MTVVSDLEQIMKHHLSSLLSATLITGGLLTNTVLAHPDHDETTSPAEHELLLIQTATAPASNSSVSIATEGEFRVIKSNGIPDHTPGDFPRRGNPNVIKPQSYSFRMPLKPKAAAEPIHRGGFWWGVAINGVPFEPGTGESWNNDMRSGWRYEAATGFLNLGLDEHNAHVQPNGAYHYHALPTGIVKEHGGDEKNMLLVAWSADGFPVYTAQAYSDPKDAKSPLKKMKSSYQLKKGARPSVQGGPSGNYDGRFTQDFEFIKGSGDLDDCNGRFGVTPEFPEGTYYYCISADFPFVARMWRAEPDASFNKGDRPPGAGGGLQQAPLGGAPRGIMEGGPSPAPNPGGVIPALPSPGGGAGMPRMPVIGAIDKNSDGTLDQDELKNAAAALLSLDKNGDGKLTTDEYRGTLPGGARPGAAGVPRQGQ